MRNVLLLVPTVLAGAIRYPVEGPILVTDDKAEELIDKGQAESADIEEAADGDDLDDKKVEDLKAIAVAEEVDLGDATKKADIIAKIRAHRDAASAQ